MENRHIFLRQGAIKNKRKTDKHKINHNATLSLRFFVAGGETEWEDGGV